VQVTVRPREIVDLKLARTPPKRALLLDPNRDA
jgi:hypothetical protein